MPLAARSPLGLWSPVERYGCPLRALSEISDGGPGARLRSGDRSMRVRIHRSGRPAGFARENRPHLLVSLTALGGRRHDRCSREVTALWRLGPAGVGIRACTRGCPGVAPAATSIDADLLAGFPDCRSDVRLA
jgi:hypothetical protein